MGPIRLGTRKENMVVALAAAVVFGLMGGILLVFRVSTLAGTAIVSVLLGIILAFWATRLRSKDQTQAIIEILNIPVMLVLLGISFQRTQRASHAWQD